jgi:hypothetical protein
MWFLAVFCEIRVYSRNVLRADRIELDFSVDMSGGEEPDRRGDNGDVGGEGGGAKEVVLALRSSGSWINGTRGVKFDPMGLPSVVPCIPSLRTGPFEDRD